ncbi:plasmid pRiA4b ORF-3-like protein-domain-containing protein [Lineolata rhizophorae]|uniref:Plasmid pRiA4b ORF-3-like protein-domain-containing protein n=1 Tax=Lineolata rhizophorae TaxID=578093 RepID=A0A6A6NMM1_9PEZI|nr:plasmid pRiA4b ORF-3-like protein-domain-containing protein [Lineolata rhizophorae]
MPGIPTHVDGRPIFGPPRPPHHNYILHVRLCPEQIVDPPVSRVLSCPGDATFDDLHKALQIAFGWATTHCYDFKVRNPAYAAPDEETEMLAMIQRLRRQNGVDPEGVDHDHDALSRSPPKSLLRLIQKQDPRKWPLGIGVDSMFANMEKHPLTPERPAKDVKLNEVFEDAKYRGRAMEYEYDFGDHWVHDISVEGRANATRAFECLDGSGHAVAEDAGGPHKWQELKQAYRAPEPSQEQRETMQWFEREASNRDVRGLAGGRERVWDRYVVNRRLMEEM